MKTAVLFFISIALLSACSHHANEVTNKSTALRCTNTVSNFECDRKAILAMAGEYEVNFHFEETAALRVGYEKKHGHNSKAKEWVNVIEDSGHKISLQHILISDKGEVTKHWRQDWVYKPVSAWEFSGTHNAQQWRQLPVDEKQRQHAWLQTVWHVDDSPRYASVGRWQHQANLSNWTGNTTQRPLPRREYSTRSDYDVLIANNRHEITPKGWVHWQDNVKWDSKAATGDHAVARELGINTYTRVSGTDFSPAVKYWNETKEYWSLVRAQWQQTFDKRGQFAVKEKIDAMTMWLTLSAAADETVADTPEQKQEEIAAIFDRYILPANTVPNLPTLTVAQTSRR